VYSPRCYNVIIFVDFASVLSFCRELQGMNAGDEKVLLKGQITKQREQIILKAKAATAGWDAAAQSDERYVRYCGCGGVRCVYLGVWSGAHSLTEVTHQVFPGTRCWCLSAASCRGMF
jgi:hypothetical protein